MSRNDSKLIALEKLLQKKSEDISASPNLTDDLFGTYIAILRYLRRQVYPLIDAGLAALSEENGFYTLHGPEHFDDVVKYAGLLLGYETGEENTECPLKTYELFVLLVAIRLHDAGNAYGRENHEKKAYFILNEMGNIAGDNRVEKRLIASIAEAHGGKTLSGSKDTIGQLPVKKGTGHLTIRPRLIAAIVRFADEICENRRRAAILHLQSASLPKHSEVFHAYASCINAVVVVPNEKTISMEFSFELPQTIKKWGKKKQEDGILEVYLTDETFSRLEKMFLEMQYCSKFMRGICDFERISIEMYIYRNDENYTLVKHRTLLLEEEGYPNDSISLSTKYPELTGESLIQEYGEVLNSSQENEHNS